jgi:hypothetical protein
MSETGIDQEDAARSCIQLILVHTVHGTFITPTPPAQFVRPRAIPATTHHPCASVWSWRKCFVSATLVTGKINPPTFVAANARARDQHTRPNPVIRKSASVF